MSLHGSSSSPCAHSLVPGPAPALGGIHCGEQAWTEPSLVLFVKEGGERLQVEAQDQPHETLLVPEGSAVSSHRGPGCCPGAVQHRRSPGTQPRSRAEESESVFGLSLAPAELVFRPSVLQLQLSLLGLRERMEMSAAESAAPRVSPPPLPGVPGHFSQQPPSRSSHHPRARGLNP